MSVTATGMFAVPVSQLAELLGSLDAFQTWVGAADAPEAAESIHAHEFLEPERGDGQSEAEYLAARQAKRPYAVIGWGTQFDAEPEAAGESYWPKRGALWVEFRERAQNDSGPEASGNPVGDADALVHLMNHVGAILEDLEAAVAAGGTLAVTSWLITEPAARETHEAIDAGQVDDVSVILQVNWSDM